MIASVFFYLLTASSLATLVVFAACAAAASADELQQGDRAPRASSSRGHQIARPLTNQPYSL